MMCRLNTNLFPDCVKIIECLASAVNVVSSNRRVGTSQEIKITFPLLSKCTDELIPVPKIMVLSFICK